ncbi:MAG: PilZ domain-containing protein [Candidatus Omnitrophica bacterium]|nr:PilZ domain-containing protein [Candidatus Omnitrophota bacterium]
MADNVISTGQDRKVERRASSRYPLALPVCFDDRLYGTTLNLSREGACVAVPSNLPLLDTQTFNSLKVKLSNTERVFIPAVAVRHEKTSASRLTVGMRFHESGYIDPEQLETAYKGFVRIDDKFASETKKVRRFVEEIKLQCDLYDQSHPKEEDRLGYLNGIEQELRGKFDAGFAKAWKLYAELPPEGQRTHQLYFQLMLHDLVEENVEINRHIYRKPLGYAGDFIMMNYIYNYHNGAYIGATTFERIVNHYTCSIPISKSNIGRKEFLKQQLLSTIDRCEQANILSVGSGPLRELTELALEGKLSKPIRFTCVDFEQKAVEYSKSEIETLELAKRGLISFEFVLGNVVAIIRNKNFREKLKSYDLIYASGVFDYLSDRLSSALIHQLYESAREKGRVIVFNASLDTSSHRGYYELLGEWNMYHRTESEMLRWLREDLRKAARFEKHPACPDYLLLVLDKP